MDEVFGDAAGSAKEDLARQAEINRRLGLDRFGSHTNSLEEKNEKHDDHDLHEEIKL